MSDGLEEAKDGRCAKYFLHKVMLYANVTRQRFFVVQHVTF